MEKKNKTFVSFDGETPNGGVRTEVHFFDAEGRPCEEDKAVKSQILEFDASGVCVFSLISDD